MRSTLSLLKHFLHHPGDTHINLSHWLIMLLTHVVFCTDYQRSRSGLMNYIESFRFDHLIELRGTVNPNYIFGKNLLTYPNDAICLDREVDEKQYKYNKCNRIHIDPNLLNNIELTEGIKKEVENTKQNDKLLSSM